MPPTNSPPTSAADRLRAAASFNIPGWTTLMRIANFLSGGLDQVFWKSISNRLQRPGARSRMRPLTVGIGLIGLSGAGREAWAA